MKKPRPPAYIFVSPVSFTSLREVQKIMPQEPEAVLAHPRSILEALTVVDTYGRGVILVAVADAKHLKIATQLSTQLKTRVQAGLIKLAVISSLEYDGLPKILKKHGFEEVISPEVNPKGLKLKLMRLMTLVEASWAKAGLNHAPSTGPSESEEGGEAFEEKKKAEVKAVPALKVSDDCWIIRGRAFKRVQNMWIIRVQGPSPNTGRWTKVANQTQSWVWVPRDPANPFVTEGVWTFYGRQPENKDKEWMFVGEEPRLTYSRKGEDVCNRFEGTNEPVLRVARNSRSALRKSAAIAASYDNELRTRKVPRAGEPTEIPTPTAIHTPSAVPDWAQDSPAFGQEEGTGLDTQEDLAIGPPAPPFADGKFGNKTVMELDRLPFYEEILEELGPRTEMFSVISNRKDCLALMRESAHLHSPAILWTRGQKFRSSTSISHFAAKTGAIGIKLPTGFDWPRLLSSFQKVEAKEVYINANLGRTAIFFKQPLSELQGSDAALEVSCPDKIYEVQRRKDLRHRLRATEDTKAELILDNVASEWKILDISAGGICVRRKSGAKDPADGLARGSRIGIIRFEVYGQSVQCAARVAWIKRNGPQGEISLGLQFDQITHSDREGIRLYVMEENYDYLKNNVTRLSDDDE